MDLTSYFTWRARQEAMASGAPGASSPADARPFDADHLLEASVAGHALRAQEQAAAPLDQDGRRLLEQVETYLEFYEIARKTPRRR